MGNLVWVPLLLFPGFAILGLVFVVLGVRAVRETRRRTRAWVRVPGTVVGTRWTSSGTGVDSTHNRFLQVRYALPDGSPRTFWNRYGSNMTRQREGDQVTVLVDPAKPDDAVVDGFVNGGGCFGALALFVGSLFLGTGLLGTAITVAVVAGTR
jgi:hypothetical protein